MAERQPAAHRTILIVDVEGFGDRRRTNWHQLEVRDGMYRALRRAFAEARIPWGACRREDRGDGVLVLAPPDVPKTAFVETLPHALSEALNDHNQGHPAQERIRLRMALHAGEINYDDNGVTATSINLTFRLVDSAPLRSALKNSDGVLALIVSSWFFDEVVRHSPTSDAGGYRACQVKVKETAATGWICVPNETGLPHESNLKQSDAALSLPSPRDPQEDSHWTADTSSAVGLPVVVPTGQLPPKVRGRDELLAELGRRFRRPSGNWLVLTGMGGIGKSTVATEFADRVQHSRRRRRRPLVWWVPAADQASLTGALVTVARQLGATPTDVDAIGSGAPDGPDRLWALLKQSRQRWLLIFDNADEPAVLARPKPIRPHRQANAQEATRSLADGTGWVRPHERGLLVVTSRNGSHAVWGRHAQVLPVAPLGENDAALVLMDRAPSAGDAAEARALAQRLGGLPLALRLVGCYLESRVALQGSFHDYRQTLEDPAGTPRLLTSQPDIDPSTADARAVVMHTWEMSLDALARSGIPQARPLLRLLSCYASPTPIPLGLLTPERLTPLLTPTSGNACDATAHERAEHRLEDGLNQLRLLGLVDMRRLRIDGTNKRALVVHPVVADTNHAHLLDDRDATVDAALIRHTAVRLVATALGSLDPEFAADWPEHLAISPHIHTLLEKVARYLGCDDLRLLVITASRSAQALDRSGSVAACERLLEAAMNVRPGLNDDDPAILQVRHLLAWAAGFQGRSTEAETAFREVLPLRQRVLGDEHPDTLNTRHELAWVAAAQGRWAEAETSYWQVLSARRRVLGAEHPDTLITHHELGWAIANQGHGDHAAAILREVLDARGRVLGAAHPRTLQTRHELAWIAANQGRWAVAEMAYRDLLDTRQNVLGADHPDTLTTRHELAWTIAEQGKRTAAAKEYRQVLHIRLRVLGNDHPDTIASRASIERLQQGLTTPARHLA